MKKILLVKGILRNKKKEILFTRRATNLKYNPGKMTIPGLHIDTGETAPEAVVRENFEETGLSDKIDQKVETITTQGDEGRVLSITYFTCIPKNTKVKVDPKEVSEYMWSLEIPQEISEESKKILRKIIS